MRHGGEPLPLKSSIRLTWISLGQHHHHPRYPQFQFRSTDILQTTNTIRPVTLLSALTLATISAAAAVDSQGSAAIVARGHEIEAHSDPTLPSNQQLEKRHLSPRWEDGSETFEWPADSVGHGTVDYQFVVTNLGNNNYRAQFYHSGPANGRDIGYNFTAPGISIIKTLKPRSSTSFEVTKSGDGFQVKVERP